MEPDPHFKSSWIRICIQKTAGFGSAKNECGSTALMVGEIKLSKSRVVRGGRGGPDLTESELFPT